MSHLGYEKEKTIKREMYNTALVIHGARGRETYITALVMHGEPVIIETDITALMIHGGQG